MILDDIKSFLAEKSLCPAECIKFDYDSSKGEETILLHLYDNVPCDLARRSKIKMIIKFNDLKLARDTAFAMHDLFFPENSFQKSVKINEKTMHAKLNKGPYYQGKDQSKRHNYVLDITLTYNR